MCLVAFAIDAAPGCGLWVAANRDEYLERPTAALHRWQLDNGVAVVGGRDLRDGGMWMGVTASGRVAWLTNVRQADLARGERSRGELVTRWLRGDVSLDEFTQSLGAADYAGFNLVVGSIVEGGWTWISNRDPGDPHGADPRTSARLHCAAISPGVHTLSNASLNTPWPKSRRLSDALRHALHAPAEADGLLGEALTDARHAQDAELPSSGVPIEVERALSSPFVRMPERGYATRTSTVLRVVGAAVTMDEWTHAPNAALPSLATAAHRREVLTVP
ncbi:MAG: NRDE family protein [Hydrogenophaga sp.]|uniref:NRDE family protein n=1 Tax=Hydrogenophaga sp. TaxID=1904254 RepID=UPI001E19BC87|nr:NRDE family protein [Hydrogenophaga sp.]MBX3611395.1 NRDE family protein [Hydrogenophaga sp.]